MIRTLVIDDDYRVATIHAADVERVPGFSVVGRAHSIAEAGTAISDLRPHLILLDLYLPDGHGLDIVRGLPAASGVDPDFVVITAARDVDTVRAAMRQGALHYLVKPFGFAKLRERLIAYRDLRQRLASIEEANQEQVDDLYSLLRAPTSATLPKRHSAPTMALVKAAVREASDDVSAAEVASRLGISRPTAQRYLSYLAQHRVIELRLRYGGPGRPEQRYRMAPSGGAGD
jgi:response regulator of citrate/malate metabolism